MLCARRRLRWPVRPPALLWPPFSYETNILLTSLCERQSWSSGGVADGRAAAFDHGPPRAIARAAQGDAAPRGGARQEVYVPAERRLDPGEIDHLIIAG